MPSSLRRRPRALIAPLVRSILVASLATGALLAGGAPAALANDDTGYTDCADVSANLLPDCSFEGFGIGWTASTTDDDATAGTGYYYGPHSGGVVADLRAGWFAGSAASWSTSVQVVAGRTYSFGVWWTQYSSGLPGTVSMSVSGAVADATTPSASVAADDDWLDDGWVQLSGGSFRATQSGPVTLQITNTSSAIVLIDDAALWRPGGPAVSVVAYDASVYEDRWQGVLPVTGSYSSSDGPYVVAAPIDLLQDGGWEFAAWNTRADGTGATYLPGASISPAEDITLYAQWQVPVSVDLQISSRTQVYRTTDPGTLSAQASVDNELFVSGVVRFKHSGTLIGTVSLDNDGLAEMPVPTSLPLGRTSFTAEYVPRWPAGRFAVSAPAQLTVARVSTTTSVTLRQQTLSPADQKKYKLRSGIAVSVQVTGGGTRTAAAGKVALNIGGKVTTLALANGRVSALVPSAAGTKLVTALYQPSTDIWVRSTGRGSITVR